MSRDNVIRPYAYEHAPFLGRLAEVSAAMGRDLEQVQGPGGNTSLKHEGVLWVKASGTDLADAEGNCIFIPVDLDAARDAIRAEDDRPIAALDIPQAEGMRPSIECSLHALMPQRVVMHNHDVHVIAWAARRDAESALSEALGDLNWAFVPYARPGLPLTRAVASILEDRQPDILILGNHGLVVGADTPENAADQLAAVRRRLELQPRTVPYADTKGLQQISGGSRFVVAAAAEAHAAALDEAAFKLVTGGALYPDHVVFLGGETAVIAQDGGSDLDEIEARLVLVPGCGVLIEASLPPAAHAMAACLGLVATRFPADAEPAYLGTDDIAALLGWDAEIYRQELARRKAAARE